MTLDHSQFTTVYQKIFKSKKWQQQLLYAINGILYLVLYNDNKDYYYIKVGQAENDICYMGDFTSLTTLLKHFDGPASLSVKKDKMMISNDDNSIQFVIMVNEQNFTLPDSNITAKKNLDLNKDQLSVASKFTGVDFPTNLIHLDSDKGFFVTDSSKVLSYNYKNLDISIEKQLAPLLLIQSTSSISLSDGNDQILLKEKNIDDGVLSAPVYTTPDQINPFKDIIKQSVTYVTLNKDAFLNAFNPHLINNGNISVIISEGVAKFRSHSENSSALQTTLAFPDNEIKVQYKIKDIENLIPLFSDTISLGIHPDHENVFCIFDDNMYFASI